MVGMIKESERNWRPRLVFGKKRRTDGRTSEAIVPAEDGEDRACQSCLAVAAAAAAKESE